VIARGDSAKVILYNPYNGVGIVAPINRNNVANATIRNDLLLGQVSLTLHKLTSLISSFGFILNHPSKYLIIKVLIYNILSYKIDKITDLIEYKKIYNFFVISLKNELFN
jgi:hypothetical protein